MKRSDYQKPTMKVIELRQRAKLLTNSITSTRSAAAMNVVYEEEDI
jgi:hypothetical protein